jgi:NADH-quinone oxidoreductase subunit N
VNAPIIWIVLPLGLSGGLFLISRWRRVAGVMGSVFALLLAAAAWLLPVGNPIQLGIVSFELQPGWIVFGRRFFLENSDRPFVILLYLTIAFWFMGTLSLRCRSLLIPLGMAISAILIAALLVQPFYYGFILLFFATILSVFLFVSEQGEVHLGIKRYWIFQSLAMPLLLLAGWLLSGTEANPGEIANASLIYVLLLLGLALLLSSFPFQSWLPAVAQVVSPYAFSFVVFVIFLSYSLFTVAFLRQFTWLSSSSWILLFFSFQGFLLTILGGMGAIYHRHLGRWMGYAQIKETGLSFLSIGLGLALPDQSSFLAILFLQILPRSIALALWGLVGNLYLEHGESLQIQDLVGVGRHYPIATAAFFLSVLTLVGFPLTAAFPIHLLIWQGWFQNFPPVAFAAIFGSVGVLIGGLRAMAVLVRSDHTMEQGSLESRSQAILLTIGSVLLLLMGIFPSWFLSVLYNLGITFFKGS